MTREEAIVVYDELCVDETIRIPCYVSTNIVDGEGHIIDVDCTPHFPVFKIDIKNKIEKIPCIGVMRNYYR